MSQYPRYSLSGGNQYPAVATAIPAQYPTIELVDGTGTIITNVGNGPADGTWTTLTLLNGTEAGSSAPMYMKDSRDIVHFRGQVTNVPDSSTAYASVPAGYRRSVPNFIEYGPTGTLTQANGTLSSITGAAPLTLELDMIHYLADS